MFGDADYGRNQQQDGGYGEWEQALWVLTQVMSVTKGRRLAVVDAGLKAVSLDSGPPVLQAEQTGGVQVGVVHGFVILRSGCAYASARLLHLHACMCALATRMTTRMRHTACTHHTVSLMQQACTLASGQGWVCGSKHSLRSCEHRTTALQAMPVATCCTAALQHAQHGVVPRHTYCITLL